MKINPDIHHRRSIRLKGYDYSQVGAYFVTICARNRACLFGEIAGGQMMLNDAGRMVAFVWNKLPIRFAHVELDEFVVMPNHIHGIFMLHRRDEPCRGEPCRGEPCRGEPCRGEPCVRPGVRADSSGLHNSQWGEYKIRPYIWPDSLADPISGEPCRGEPCVRPDVPPGSCVRPRGTLPDTVGRIVQAFKSITTHEYIKGVKQHGWSPFPGKLWQRNYYDHIIRNEDALNRIREYIATNPMKWEFDRENPNLSILETPGPQWEGPS